MTRSWVSSFEEAVPANILRFLRSPSIQATSPRQKPRAMRAGVSHSGDFGGIAPRKHAPKHKEGPENPELGVKDPVTPISLDAQPGIRAKEFGVKALIHLSPLLDENNSLILQLHPKETDRRRWGGCAPPTTVGPVSECGGCRGPSAYRAGVIHSHTPISQCRTSPPLPKRNACSCKRHR